MYDNTHICRHTRLTKPHTGSNAFFPAFHAKLLNIANKFQ